MNTEQNETPTSAASAEPLDGLSDAESLRRDDEVWYAVLRNVRDIAGPYRLRAFADGGGLLPIVVDCAIRNVELDDVRELLAAEDGDIGETIAYVLTVKEDEE